MSGNKLKDAYQELATALQKGVDDLTDDEKSQVKSAALLGAENDARYSILAVYPDSIIPLQ